ncbi:oxidoreductase domain-containing protein [Rivularia sp. IAM M-261]|nr:oxidoreductase domain-containing protein [Calothrix sp. PCC 7716]GJD18914.1 oxidoreductase domain-containing protein [Rivularia sp. IAM M-261]
MLNKINTAVIGVGRWGVHWLRILLEHPQANLKVVVDPNPERLEAVKRQYNLGDDVVLTTNAQTLQYINELEAVVVATPAVTHYSLITDALKWRLHVLAEKPLTLLASECRELCELALKQQRILMVDHTYLFHPAVERGRSVIESGSIGDLRYGCATRTHLGPVRQDVDALWDLAIHDIAIFNTWLGEVPVKAQATGTVWLQQKSNLADLVWTILTYKSGFTAHIHLCWLNNDKQRRLSIVGSKGSLIFDEMSQAPLTLINGEFEVQGNLYVPINQSQQILELEKAEPLKKVCSHFLQCIQTNTSPTISDAFRGAELVQILTALTKSLHSGGTPINLDY